MRRIVTGLLALACMPVAANAQDQVFACSRDGVVRKIAVTSAPDSGRACEVRYQRASEGGPSQRLWHAQSDPAFCESQVKTLVSRLAEAGWSCGPSLDSSAAAVAPGEPRAVPVAVAAPVAGSQILAIVKPEGLTASIAPRVSPAVQPQFDPNLFQLRPTIHD